MFGSFQNFGRLGVQPKPATSAPAPVGALAEDDGTTVLCEDDGTTILTED